MKLMAMVPARMGSERLRLQNLSLLDGHPLISYTVEAAQASGVFDQVVLTSDGTIFQEVAKRYGIDFYLRPAELGFSETKSDTVVPDFMQHNPSDIVAWVNPISSFQTVEEVQNVTEYFTRECLYSLITVETQQVHCVYQGLPVKFWVDEIFAKNQELTPLQARWDSTQISGRKSASP